LPKGLIRYASEDEIEKKSKFVFTARMKGYAAVLIILTGILTGLLFMRSEVEAKILRLPGQWYEHKGENISNVYTYKIANKTSRDYDNVTIKLAHPKGTLQVRSEEGRIAKQVEIRPSRSDDGE